MKKQAAVATVVLAMLVAPVATAAAADTPREPGAATSARKAGEPGRRIVRRLAVAADAIGVKRTELWRALRDGQSIAAVARANDVDPQTVIDAVVDAATEKIDAAVANGRLDETRAAAIKDGLPAAVAKLVNAEPGPRAQNRLRRAAVRRHARRGALEVAATTIGVKAKELREALRDGQSVAAVARANDVDPRTVIDAVVDAATTKIDAAVANGRLDETRAAAIKDRLEHRVTRRINASRDI